MVDWVSAVVTKGDMIIAFGLLSLWMLVVVILLTRKGG